MPSNHGVGNQSLTCALEEYGTASGLIHPQSSQVSNLLFCLSLGGMPGGEDTFSSGNWLDLNL